MSLGWTVGEEILYDDNEVDGIRRRESCISVTDSCLIQFSIDDLIAMSS